MIRCLVSANISFSTGAMYAALIDDARDLGVGRVGHEQVNALGPAPGEAAQVRRPAVQRKLVHLEVAGVQDHPGRGGDGHRERVGDGVVDGEELRPNGPKDTWPPSATSAVTGVIRCSVSLLRTRARVSREPMSGILSRWRSR